MTHRIDQYSKPCQRCRAQRRGRRGEPDRIPGREGGWRRDSATGPESAG